MDLLASAGRRCRARLVALAIGTTAAVSVGSAAGCHDDSIEACYWQDLEVELFAEPPTGAAPLSVDLVAYAEPFSCGCCSEEDTEIARYEWDLDGDGRFERAGGDLDELEHVLDEPGEHEVTVRVEDSAGTTVTDSISVSVSPPSR